MRLGTRWGHGDEPPRALPDAVRDVVNDVGGSAGPGSWTLTWLEGRPIVEHDTGVRVRVTRGGEVVVDDVDDDLEDHG